MSQEVLVPLWEYSERTWEGKQAWVPMEQECSTMLEEAFVKDQKSIVVFPIPDEEDNVVREINLGNWTQRRLRDGENECTKWVRRIHMSPTMVQELVSQGCRAA